MQRNPGIRSYRDLIVWQKAVLLVAECYRSSARLPRDERFGLVSQLRRAAVSVAANIAEGHGRRSPRDFARYVGIARGSLMEVETYLSLTTVLGMLPPDDVVPAQRLVDEISRMLSAFRRRLTNA